MKKNVLLVDDDRICSFLSEKVLSSLGFINEIQFALNGKQAIEMLNHHMADNMDMPDIIFLDLNMPVMNGYEFLDKFNSMDFPNKASIVIVVLTSSADPRDMDKAKYLGAKYYFNKPITQQEIKKMIGDEFELQSN